LWTRATSKLARFLALEPFCFRLKSYVLVAVPP
jgi:hypothetical protein